MPDRAARGVMRTRLTTEPAPAPVKGLRVVLYYVYFACLMGANVVLLLPARAFGATGNNTAFNASWLILCGAVFLLALPRIERHARNLMFTVGVIAYVFASVLWSVAPSSTLTYATLFAGNVLAAYVMATDLPLNQLAGMTGKTILVLCAAGIVAYYLDYTQVFYYDTHGRPNLLGGQPFRAFFVHKITAGFYASMGAIWAVLMLRGISRFLALAVFAWTIALAGSSTGIVLFICGISIAIIVAVAGRNGVAPGKFFATAITVAAAGSVLIAANWSAILAALGRDETLTGRTDLWQLGLDAWMQRPILGWGFSAYFDSPFALELQQQVARFQNYAIPHFHQSEIQTAVDLGIVGLLVVVAMIARTLYRAYNEARRSRAAAAVFAYLALITLSSSVMFAFVTYNHFATFAIFLFFFALRPRASSIDRSPRDHHINMQV